MKILILSFIVLTSSLSLAFDHKHSLFANLLNAHVKMSPNKTSSVVDYKNFNTNQLNKYLKSISSVEKKDFNNFTVKQQLAFYINAYNAYTIKLILDNYPVKSIKKIGTFFSSPWKKKFFKLFKEDSFLNQIEHKFVRASKTLGNDARIHFAFNCASIGCPALLNTPWIAEKLNSQFESAAQNFLKDHSRNRVNIKNKSVQLSNIFKWYGNDFKTKNYKSLKAFLTIYANSIAINEKEKALILSKDYSITFSGYDWNLNSL